MKSKKNSKKGFTLIELIIVIVIIAVLAAVAIPAVSKYVADANLATATANIKLIERGVMICLVDVPFTSGTLPYTGNDEPLKTISADLTEFLGTGFVGKYAVALPLSADDSLLLITYTYNGRIYSYTSNGEITSREDY